jgi:hypothetical protein
MKVSATECVGSEVKEQKPLFGVRMLKIITSKEAGKV